MSITIENVDFLSKQSQEAYLTLSDTRFCCHVFCHPFDGCEGKLRDVELLAFNCNNLKVESDSIELIESSPNDGSCYVVGQLFGATSSVVTVGEFRIELDGVLPGDARPSDMISFTCERLDMLSFQRE